MCVVIICLFQVSQTFSKVISQFHTDPASTKECKTFHKPKLNVITFRTACRRSQVTDTRYIRD